jgi:release factor glutamine methyltransferase
VITFLAQILGEAEAYYVASDINPYALKATQKVVSKNGVPVDMIRCSLISGIKSRFDLAVFNPPYVATSNDEMQQNDMWISSSWAGGTDGTVLLYKFLEGLSHILAVPGIDCRESSQRIGRSH